VRHCGRKDARSATRADEHGRQSTQAATHTERISRPRMINPGRATPPLIARWAIAMRSRDPSGPRRPGNQPHPVRGDHRGGVIRCPIHAPDHRGPAKAKCQLQPWTRWPGDLRAVRWRSWWLKASWRAASDADADASGHNERLEQRPQQVRLGALEVLGQEAGRGQ
jgi:hypothetical protein